MGVTILAFALSKALVAPFTTQAKSFFSAPERNDYTISDFFAQIANDRAVRTLEDRIAVVDIGRGGREEIAEILETLKFCEPKVIGLDVNFDQPTEDDSRLLEAISNSPSLVLPLCVESKGDDSFSIFDKSFFYGKLAGPSYGVVNFPTATPKSSVREFSVNFPMTDRSVLPSFVTAILEKADPAAAQELRKRGNRYETTSYHSKEFNIFSADDILTRPEMFADRIVLVGALDEASDMHATPVNSYMPGLLIHAHALSTALDREWYVKLPKWVDTLLALGICFLIVLATMGIRNGVRGMLVRFLQLFMVYISVRIGYALFVDRHVIFDFSNTLVMIAFGLFAVDIWNGLAAAVKYMSIKLHFRKQQEKQQII